MEYQQKSRSTSRIYVQKPIIGWTLAHPSDGNAFFIRRYSDPVLGFSEDFTLECDTCTGEDNYRVDIWVDDANLGWDNNHEFTIDWGN